MVKDAALDVVVWGATGFTGQLVVEYLCGPAGDGVAWAVAGRTASKLEAVVAATGASVPVVQCDVTDAAGMAALARSTKVVLSTAGPFSVIGEPLIKACVEAGTDYVDITGEIPWVKTMQDKYGAAAAASGALLCSCCGFDSAPSDLGTLYGVSKLRERFGADVAVSSVRNFATLLGGLSGGTLASGIAVERDPVLSKMLHEPNLLGERPARPQDADVKDALFDADANTWVAPFVMAGINTRIVRKSAEALGYGADFVYREVAVAPSEKVARKMARPGPPADKRAELMAAGKLPKQGEGPSAEQRAKSSFNMLFCVEAEAKSGSTAPNVWVQVSGGDPGYTETAKMVAEASLCLAKQRSTIPRAHGFHTPATAMGSALIERLQAAGISFRQVTPPTPAKL